jgi:hypothetical protein
MWLSLMGPVADQIAGRKMKDAATGEEDRCGRRRRRWRHYRRNRSRDNVNFGSVCIFRHFSTCLEIQIEVPAVSTCFLICGSSHFGAETRERVPIQTVPVKPIRPLCQSTRTWCKVSLEIRNYYPM